jgi:hypothetical protein
MSSAIENAGIEKLVSAQFLDGEVRKNSIPYKARLPTCNLMERLTQGWTVMFLSTSQRHVLPRIE